MRYEVVIDAAEAVNRHGYFPVFGLLLVGRGTTYKARWRITRNQSERRFPTRGTQ
jgi:hypothetical protein